MLKEIALPGNCVVTGQPASPESDGLGKNLIWRKADYEMDMIRHQDSKMTKPSLFLVVKANGIENGRSHGGMAKMVLISRLCTEGDKIIGTWRDPMRCGVIEVFTFGHA